MLPHDFKSDAPKIQVYKDWWPYIDETINAIRKAGLMPVHPQEVMRLVPIHRRPDVILLNGPASSGKSWLAEQLRVRCADTYVISTPTVIYAAMQAHGLPFAEPLTYKEFKERVPFARDYSIVAGLAMRAVHEDFVNRIMTSHANWRLGNLIIVDNVGFEGDIEFFVENAARLVVIQLDSEVVQNSQHAGTRRVPIDRSTGCWINDSRRPLESKEVIHWINSQLAAVTLFGNINGKGLTFDWDRILHMAMIPPDSHNVQTLYEILRHYYNEPPAARDLFAPKS